MADKPWFLTGQAGEQRAIAEKELQDEKSLSNKRFWMKAGNTVKDVVFLDDLGFFLHEHTFQSGQKWYNATCVNEIPTLAPCPICKTYGEDTSSYVGVYTVIDTRRWEGENGKVFENQPKLFVAKTKVQAVIREEKKKRGGLIGCVYDITRAGDQDPRTGSMFSFTEKLTPEQVAARFPGVKPYSYEEVFRPKTAEEMKRLYAAVAAPPVGSAADLARPAQGANLAPVPEGAI